MKCRICNTELVERSGKLGQFLACLKSYKGNNHGTISLQRVPLALASVASGWEFGKDVQTLRFLDHVFNGDSTSKSIEEDLVDWQIVNGYNDQGELEDGSPMDYGRPY